VGCRGLSRRADLLYVLRNPFAEGMRGGTALPTPREALSIMDCAGTGKAKKFAEIVAAALLGGEISMGAAITTGEFVAAHEMYGRNRPK